MSWDSTISNNGANELEEFRRRVFDDSLSVGLILTVFTHTQGVANFSSDRCQLLVGPLPSSRENRFPAQENLSFLFDFALADILEIMRPLAFIASRSHEKTAFVS